MRRGFTLIELLVVVAILIILAAILLPIFANRTEEARIARMAADIRTLRTAVLMFQADTGRLPNNLGELAGTTNVTSIPNWRGPYIERDSLVSPWGTAISFNYIDNTGGSNGWDTICAGATNVPDFDYYTYLEITVDSTKKIPPNSSIAKLDQSLDDGNGTDLNTSGYVCVDNTSTPTKIYVFLGGQL